MGTSYAVEGSAKNTVVNPYCHSLRRMAAATSRRHNRNAWLVTVLTLPRPVSRLPTSGRTEPRITAPNERVIAGSASSRAGHRLSLCRQHSPPHAAIALRCRNANSAEMRAPTPSHSAVRCPAAPGGRGPPRECTFGASGRIFDRKRSTWASVCRISLGAPRVCWVSIVANRRCCRVVVHAQLRSLFTIGRRAGARYFTGGRPTSQLRASAAGRKISPRPQHQVSTGVRIRLC
jgi:hypothetical protein